MCSWGDVAVRVLFAFPGVQGWVGGGAASKSWTLKKNFKDSSLLPSLPPPMDTTWEVHLQQSTKKFILHHAHIHESPLVVITL